MGPHRMNGEGQGYRPRVTGDKSGSLLGEVSCHQWESGAFYHGIIGDFMTSFANHDS
jgi:hypothetical protein